MTGSIWFMKTKSMKWNQTKTKTIYILSIWFLETLVRIENISYFDIFSILYLNYQLFTPVFVYLNISCYALLFFEFWLNKFICSPKQKCLYKTVLSNIRAYILIFYTKYLNSYCKVNKIDPFIFPRIINK